MAFIFIFFVGFMLLQLHTSRLRLRPLFHSRQSWCAVCRQASGETGRTEGRTKALCFRFRPRSTNHGRAIKVAQQPQHSLHTPKISVHQLETSASSYLCVSVKDIRVTLISIWFGVLDVCRKLGEDVHTGGVGLGVFCTKLDVPERDTKKSTH